MRYVAMCYKGLHPVEADMLASMQVVVAST